MATQTNSIKGSGYGNTYVDALVWGCGWDMASGPVRYAFGSGGVSADDSSIGAFRGSAWTASEENAFITALEQYAAVCGLSFAPAVSMSPGDADVVWWKTDSAHLGEGILGMHEVPDATWGPIYGYFNTDYLGPGYGNLGVGSYSYVTVIHELGHGFGLAHPHDGGGESDATKFPGVTSPWVTGKYQLNQGIWTTMSYIDGWNKQPSPSYVYGCQGTPMAFDIAALQAIYGPNNTTATGNDIYQLPDVLTPGTYWECIWDVGGADTISNTGSLGAAIINLNEAPLIGVNAAGFVSWNNGIPGGFTIAKGVVIENAIGGSGNDTLVGNVVANRLDGGAGVDTMSGGLGNDVYVVDNILDKVIEASNAGTDTIEAHLGLTLGSNLENLTLLEDAGSAKGAGNSLANLLIGNSFANSLSGAAGNDSLIGGGGVDTLTGGRGADRFVFAVADSGIGAGNRDVITDFNARDGDRIDLRALAIDSGDVRFASGILMADIDSNGVTDFEIQLTGVSSLNLLTALIL